MMHSTVLQLSKSPFEPTSLFPSTKLEEEIGTAADYNIIDPVVRTKADLQFPLTQQKEVYEVCRCSRQLVGGLQIIIANVGKSTMKYETAIGEKLEKRLI